MITDLARFAIGAVDSKRKQEVFHITILVVSVGLLVIFGSRRQQSSNLLLEAV